MQSSDGKLPNDVDALKCKIRGTFLLIIGKVSGQADPNPSTSLKLYHACVLPKTLFGCEFCNRVTSSDVQQLEVSHHFCLKRAQSLPFLTRSDMVKGLSGSMSLEAHIDTQKLTFYGLTCRSYEQGIVRKLLLIRHYQHNNSQSLTMVFFRMW